MHPLMKFLAEEEERAAAAPPKRESRVTYKHEFQYLVAIANKHRLPLSEVRLKRQEFLRCDTNSGVGTCSSGTLSFSEFSRMFRQRFNMGPDDPIPKHLMLGCSSAQRDEFNFEDFLLW